MVGWQYCSEEGYFLNVLRNQFQCVSVDKQRFGISINFEVEYLHYHVSLVSMRNEAFSLYMPRLGISTILETFSAMSSPESSLMSSVLWEGLVYAMDEGKRLGTG